jgi:hypothetical protein
MNNGDGLEATLGKLRAQMSEAEFAKLEYQRAVDAHRKRREWAVLAIDKLVVAFVLVYVSWFLNRKLEDFRQGANARAEYRKMQVEITRDAVRAAEELETGSHLLCMQLTAAPSDAERAVIAKDGQEQLRKASVALHAASDFIDASLIGPINGLANGASDYLEACVAHKEQRQAELKRQICELRVELQAKIEQLYEGTSADVARRKHAACQ